MIPLVFDPIYSQLDLPSRHRFPIKKYQGIKDKLMAQGVNENTFHRPSSSHTEIVPILRQ